jgi:hypothetical protein
MLSLRICLLFSIVFLVNHLFDPLRFQLSFLRPFIEKKIIAKIINISHHGNNFCHTSIMTIKLTKVGLI